MKRRGLLVGPAALIALGAVSPLRADGWPARPLHFIVPRAPGGSIDNAGRLVADAIGAQLGQPAIVEARPGANGAIGAAVVARAQPDGYTWLLATVNHVTAPLLQPAPYHPVNDFVAVAHLGVFGAIAVVRSSLPVTSMAELIAWARARPGNLNYLNTGNGSTMHLNTEMLKLRHGIDLVSIQYKGMQVGIADLIAGRLDFAFTVPALVLQHIRSGTLRALAIVSEARLAELPEVPTLAELGMQDVQLDSWFVLLGPAGTPAEITGRMHDAAMQALQRPDLRRQLAANSLDPVPPAAPSRVRAMLETEYQRYERLIRDAGIKAES